MVFCLVFNIPKDEMSTVCAMIVGLVGLLMLFSTSIPFNKIRVALAISMTLALIFGAIIGARFFSLVPLSTGSSLILATFGLLSIPAYIGVHKLVFHAGEWMIAIRKKLTKKG